MTYVATCSWSINMNLYNLVNLLFSASQLPKSFLKISEIYIMPLQMIPNLQNWFYSNSLKDFKK